jgi:hypothetical protein
LDRVSQIDALAHLIFRGIGVKSLNHAKRHFFGVGARRSNNNISLSYTGETVIQTQSKRKRLLTFILLKAFD